MEILRAFVIYAERRNSLRVQEKVDERVGTGRNREVDRLVQENEQLWNYSLPSYRDRSLCKLNFEIYFYFQQISMYESISNFKLKANLQQLILLCHTFVNGRDKKSNIGSYSSSMQ